MENYKYKPAFEPPDYQKWYWGHKDSKYYYQGIPISEYCKKHNINVNTIRGRIWKKLHNKKYENYSLEEIINMVMESSGTQVKYMYKGVSLRQYCIQNNINITTINSRINSLKKKIHH